MNLNQFKLQPKKLGLMFLLWYIQQNLYAQGSWHKYSNKTKDLHHNYLRLNKALKAQCDSQLPASANQLKKFGAQVPDSWLQMRQPWRPLQHGNSIWPPTPTVHNSLGGGDVATSHLREAWHPVKHAQLFMSQAMRPYYI